MNFKTKKKMKFFSHRLSIGVSQNTCISPSNLRRITKECHGCPAVNAVVSRLGCPPPPTHPESVEVQVRVLVDEPTDRGALIWP